MTNQKEKSPPSFYLLMRQDRSRFWIHLKEIDMYLKVERPSAFWASSVLLSIGPMRLISLREKKLFCVVVVRRLDAFPGIVPHRKKERARPDL